MRPFARFVATLGLAALPVAAQAANVDSDYTSVDLTDCMLMHSDDFGSSWACPGFRGYPVHVAEGDLRLFVSYGFGAPDEKAATQTLPPFNYLGGTLEWRLTDASGDWRPFATILRWITESGEPDAENGEVLVVTRLEPGATCHVAWIDAKLTANANEIARQIADTIAEGFDCENDAIIQVPS